MRRGEGTIETLVKPDHERGTVATQRRTTRPIRWMGVSNPIVITGKNKK